MDIGDTMEQPTTRWLEEVIRRQAEDIRGINECIQKLPETLERKYVTKPEFWPVRTLVYGIAGLVLSAVFLLVVKQVLK